MHPAFSEPEDKTVKIWRYMDFTKFVALLDKSSLYFTRADKFEDPFEGVLSNKNIKTMRESVGKKGGIPSEIELENHLSFSKKARAWMLINCWNISPYESAAMWKLYLKSNEGIAIESTFEQIQKVLQQSAFSIHLGKVEYIDYDNALIPLQNIFFPFLHKRKSFAHEQELRAVLWTLEDVNVPKLGEIDHGLLVNVALPELINKVHVSPESPVWLGDLVSSVIMKYGLKIEVVKSRLSERPLY